MAITTIKGKKFNVIPLYEKDPIKKTKYESKPDSESIKAKRLIKIKKGLIQVN